VFDDFTRQLLIFLVHFQQHVFWNVWPLQELETETHRKEQCNIFVVTDNNNTRKNVYGADCHDSEPSREFIRFTWWMQNSVRRLPTFGPSGRSWATGPPVAAETTSTITNYYYSAQKLILICHFTEIESWVDLEKAQHIWLQLNTWLICTHIGDTSWMIDRRITPQK